MAQTSKKHSYDWWSFLWDAWCILSIIGIWPRFIEPRLLKTTKLTISLPDLPQVFDGTRLLYISDLHISSETSSSFLQRLSKKIRKIRPEVILLGGDLISYSHLDAKEKISSFLLSLHAPYGIYACLGNHDYSEYVTLGSDNSFVKKSGDTNPLLRGFKRLFKRNNKETKSEKGTKVTSEIPLHQELLDLLQKCGIEILHNEKKSIIKDGKEIQIIGLGDLMTGHCKPEKAFHSLDIRHPSIVLSHNPDSWPLLEPYPGDIYLFGHTHGGQVNLPFMWKKLTPIINKEMKRGLFTQPSHSFSHIPRSLYVSRGVGSTFQFRWFSTPEIVVITLRKAGLKGIKETTSLQKLLSVVNSSSDDGFTAPAHSSQNRISK